MQNVQREHSFREIYLFILSIYSLNKYLFNLFCVSGSVLGVRIQGGDKTLSCSWVLQLVANTDIVPLIPQTNEMSAVMRSRRTGMRSCESLSSGWNPRRWYLSRGLKEEEKVATC